VNPLALPELLTAPFPACASLQSALYLQGMTSQVPAVTCAVTLVDPLADAAERSERAGASARAWQRAGRLPGPYLLQCRPDAGKEHP